MKHSLTWYVIFSISVLLIYATLEFITPESHDTLTTCMFACFGGEILYCAVMKIFKLNKEGGNDGNG